MSIFYRCHGNRVLTAMFFKIYIFFAMVFILQLIEYCCLKFMMNVYFLLKRYAPN